MVKIFQAKVIHTVENKKPYPSFLFFDIYSAYLRRSDVSCGKI